MNNGVTTRALVSSGKPKSEPAPKPFSLKISSTIELLNPEQKKILKEKWQEQKYQIKDIFNPIKLAKKFFWRQLYPASSASMNLTPKTQASSIRELHLEKLVKEHGAILEDTYISNEDKIPLRLISATHPEKNTKTKIYFHDNDESIFDLAKAATDEFKQGNNIVLATYQGYSGTPGIPGKDTLVKDAKAYIDYLIDDKKIPSHSLGIVAKGLGSLVALEALSKRAKAKNPEFFHYVNELEKSGLFEQPEKLTPEKMKEINDKVPKLRNENYGDISLISPMTSVSRFFKDKFKLLPEKFIKFLVKDEDFNSSKLLENLLRFINRVDFFHGGDDNKIKKENSIELYKLVSNHKPSILNIIPGKGHNVMPQDVKKPSHQINLPIKIDTINIIEQLSNTVSHPVQLGMENSIDLIYPEIKIGDPVYAVEDGEIVGLNQSVKDRESDSFNFNPEEIQNFLVIKTKSGFYDNYVHIKQDSVKNSNLKIGSQVKAGQKIAEIGNNGMSSMLHLHFHRDEKLPKETPNTRNGFKSVPIIFN